MKLSVNGKTIKVGCSANGPNEIYSTEETRIGTWIDGKPLYRVVIPSTTPSSTTTQYQLAAVANDKETVFIDGLYNPGGTWSKIPGITNDGHLFLWYLRGAINCSVTNTRWLNCRIYIILSYTKNDDSALSLSSEAEAGDIT